MSLEPPEKLRSLQGKLYDKAKAETGYRFYLLYDKIHRPDVVAHAYALARRNDGAPGVDGVTFDRIEAAGLADWLAAPGQPPARAGVPGGIPPIFRHGCFAWVRSIAENISCR